jgi:hypothetical protein
LSASNLFGGVTLVSWDQEFFDPIELATPRWVRQRAFVISDPRQIKDVDETAAEWASLEPIGFDHR